LVERLKSNGSGAQIPRYHFNKRLVADLVIFSQLQYDSLDYDPFHPMLARLGQNLPKEEALWLSTLYMAFYNTGSAWVAFKNSKPARPLPEWLAKLPVGLQRRNLRAGKVLKHIESFCEHVKEAGSIEKHLTRGFVGAPMLDWATLKENVQRPWGNGRWSVYTTSELYQKVNKIPVLPIDIMNDGSTGPRTGLCRIYDIPEPKKQAVDLLDNLANRLFQHVRARICTKIFYLPTDHYDHGMLESQLCDFNSMCKGRYYIGRDIDRDQERIRGAEAALKLVGKRMSLQPVWDTRAAVFNHRYLGEFNGWDGRTQEAKQFYLNTGRIVDHMTILEEKRAGQLF
jgi:hypothetical protein